MSASAWLDSTSAIRLISATEAVPRPAACRAVGTGMHADAQNAARPPEQRECGNGWLDSEALAAMDAHMAFSLAASILQPHEKAAAFMVLPKRSRRAPKIRLQWRSGFTLACGACAVHLRRRSRRSGHKPRIP